MLEKCQSDLDQLDPIILKSVLRRIKMLKKVKAISEIKVEKPTDLPENVENWLNGHVENKDS